MPKTPTGSTGPTNPTRPPRFEDADGRGWQLRLTTGLIDQVAAETGVDLAPDDGDPSDLVGLFFQPRGLGRVLWSLVRRQAEASGVDRESFADALTADALCAAMQALVEAVVFFTRKTQGIERASALVAQINASNEAMRAGLKGIAQEIDSAETSEKILRLIDQGRAEVRRQIGGAFGGSASSSPARAA